MAFECMLYDICYNGEMIDGQVDALCMCGKTDEMKHTIFFKLGNVFDNVDNK